MIKFYKYHGTGNDFILINGFEEDINLTPKEIEKMCHRRFGIGADGLMILKPKDGVDFEMDFYNSDGYHGSMCGNGGRCIVAFAHDMGIITDKTTFLAPDGIHKATFHNHDKISLQLSDVNNIETHSRGLFMDTGSPHLIIFKENIDSLNVNTEGKSIRYSDEYNQEGVNVNFVSPLIDDLKVFTYERGVENQTYSCGTGTVASAIALHETKGIKSPITLQTLGGNLTVYFSSNKPGNYNNIFLEGPAVKIFEGFY